MRERERENVGAAEVEKKIGIILILRVELGERKRIMKDIDKERREEKEREDEIKEIERWKKVRENEEK